MANYPIPFNFSDDVANKKMTPLQKKVIQQTVDLLVGMKCQFAIIDTDGEKHGDLVVVPRKKKVRVQEFHSYVSPILDKLKVGELVEVPKGIYKLEELQSNICARAYARWGATSVATSVNRKTDVVEILRLK